MSLTEETIDATLDSSGQLHLSQPPQIPPGAVRVTIRVATQAPIRGVAEVGREIAAGQRARGYFGRPTEEILAEDAARQAEDEERDEEFDRVRGRTTAGGP